MEKTPLLDSFGRAVNYLRLSVTDRCNLRCFYCQPVSSFRPMPHEDLLSYEEFMRVIRLGVSLGISKIRLTGGEPLARRGFSDFLARVMETAQGLDVRLTTNATLLPGQARHLAETGLKSVNISLDSLDPATFARITGQDLLARARQALDECLEAGLRVKVNVVALRGINDHELPDFLRLAVDLPVDVRFIEFMPIGAATAWRPELFWGAEDILSQASRLADISPLPSTGQSQGPARMWRIAGGQGRLGVISGLSGHFCQACNRLRLTSDGRLRPCLYSDAEYRLRPLLRSPKVGDDHILSVLRLALARKPMGYKLLAERLDQAVCLKPMSAIGG